MPKKSQSKSQRKVKFIKNVEEDDLSEEECCTFERKSEEEKLNVTHSKLIKSSQFENINRDSRKSIGGNDAAEKPDSSSRLVQRTVSPKAVEVLNNESGDQANAQPDSASSKSECSSSTISLKAASGTLSVKKTTKALNLNVALSDNGLTNIDTFTSPKKSSLISNRSNAEKSSLSLLGSNRSSLMKDLRMQILNEKDEIYNVDTELCDMNLTKTSDSILGDNSSLELNDINGEKIRFKSFRKKFENNKFVNFLITRTGNKPGKKKKSDENLSLEAQEDIEIKTYFRDVLFYSIYLAILTTIALGMTSSNMFYLKDITERIFMDTSIPIKIANMTNSFPYDDLRIWRPREKTLRNSMTVTDFWMYAQTTMLYLFYWDFYNAKIDPTNYHGIKKMFYENQILGVPRLRQVRVTDQSCSIHPNVQRFFSNCYYFYSVFAEETSPIKSGMEGSVSATAWVYTEAYDLKTSYYWGEISIYGGGGYYLDLGKTVNQSENMIRELKDNGWISRGTRAVFIDFNLYNANVNYFCVCKLVIEFPPFGGIIPKADFVPLKLIRYLRPYDFLICACEIIHVLLVAIFTWHTIKKMKKLKTKFWIHCWNILDIFILSFSYIYIILLIIIQIKVSSLIARLSDDEYVEFQAIEYLQVSFNNLLAIAVFISWIRLFKYNTFNTITIEFNATIRKSLEDILGFFPMFFSMFIAFSLLGYLLFGSQVKDFNTVWSSSLALLQTFAGEFQYKEIENCNRFLGPLFYIAYIFFIIFVALNIFIAIINDAYSGVKSKILLEIPRKGEYLKRAFFNCLEYCCCGLDKKFKKPTSLKELYIYEKLKRTLKRAGFTDTEIKIFFSKYNINVSNVLNDETRSKLIQDLELKNVDFSENAEQFQMRMLRRRIDDLNDKIEEVENSLQPVIDKVDILLRR